MMQANAISRALPWVIVGLLALFPVLDSTFYTQLLTKVLIMAIFAMSLDLLVGYTGLVSFGHAAYFGLAGYALALMGPKYEAASLWWTLPGAIGICVVFAMVTGLVVLRTRGIYFIMVTLAFAQMLFFVFHDTKLGGGSDGVYIYAKPTMNLGETVLVNLEKLDQFYWLVLFFTAATYFLLRRILGSSFGRALMGIMALRDQPVGTPRCHVSRQPCEVHDVAPGSGVVPSHRPAGHLRRGLPCHHRGRRGLPGLHRRHRDGLHRPLPSPRRRGDP